LVIGAKFIEVEIAMSRIPRLEHKIDAAFSIPTSEIPTEYRELAEAARDVMPWLDIPGKETHPLYEEYRNTRMNVEKSRQHAERYFAMKERRDAAFKRFVSALQTLQIITES
jgi:arylsulfatase A-like enzyme